MQNAKCRMQNCARLKRYPTSCSPQFCILQFMTKSIHGKANSCRKAIHYTQSNTRHSDVTGAFVCHPNLNILLTSSMSHLSNDDTATNTLP